MTTGQPLKTRSPMRGTDPGTGKEHHPWYAAGDTRRRDVTGCVVHTDRGSQFRSRKFVQAVARHDMVGSMGRVASAADNAAMESFFTLLQKNILDHKRWETRLELRTAIITWIERTYHRRRRQVRLHKLTPIEYELIMTPPDTTAA